MAFDATSINSGPIANIFDPELLSMKLISVAFNMKLIGTNTAPSRANANLKAAKLWELRERIANLSPILIPFSKSP